MSVHWKYDYKSSSSLLIGIAVPNEFLTFHRLPTLKCDEGLFYSIFYWKFR